MRKKSRNRAVFGPLFSVLAVILGLVLVGPISPANADSGLCDVSGGYVKFDSASGSETLDWGTLTWSGTDIVYTVVPGYSIGLCVKAGTAVDTTTVNGPAAGTFQTPPAGPHGQRQGISHIGYKILDTPPPADTVLSDPSVTTHDECGTENDTITPSTSDHYTSSIDMAAHSVTFTAADHYTFAGGKTVTKSFTPNTDVPCDEPDTVLPDPSVATHDECGTENDTITPSSSDHYTSSIDMAAHSVTFTAADHYTFAGGKTVTKSFTPNTDVACDDGEHNPPGNNGTIKVDDDGLPGCSVGGSDNTKCDNGVGNDPHLGCQFYVEWYNYDANATSTVSFEVQSPTGGTVTVVTGSLTKTLDGDDASNGDNGGFDGSELYQLSFSDAPHPQQGWHVKVTTHTTGTNGESDTKFKTFWVEGDCQPIPTTPSVTMHDECGTANDSGPSFTAENEYWTTSLGEGVVYFHAKEGYYFPAGDHTSENGKTYTVSYTPNSDEPCPDEVIPVTPAVSIHDECGTANDSGPSFTAENEYWTTSLGEGVVYFHAKEGYVFPAGDHTSENGKTYTVSYTPNTDVPCKPAPVSVTEEVDGCDLSDYGLEPGTGHRDGTQDWVLVDNVWVAQDTVFGPWMQDTTLTDDEYQAQCGGPQPEPQTRIVHSEQSGCTVGGVHSWDEVYTTPFVWDDVSQSWVLGDEEGPVVENDTYTAYTAQELTDLGCVEIEGEQGHHHHGGNNNHPEVKGEQATAPAAAVPSAVEAGLAGLPAETPAGGSSLPLWALCLGAGLFLTGAGRLRRNHR